MNVFNKFMQSLDHYPLWRVASISVSSFLSAVIAYWGFNFFYITWGCLFVFIVSLCFLIFKWKFSEKKLTFHLIKGNESFCHFSTSNEGKKYTQISLNFQVYNNTSNSIGLISGKLLSPNIKGKVVSEDISFSANRRGVFTSTKSSNVGLSPKSLSYVHIHYIIQGCPRKIPEEIVNIKLRIMDHKGNSYCIKNIEAKVN